MSSDAGRALSHRRREFPLVLFAILDSRSTIFSSLLANFSPFLNLFLTLSNLWFLLRPSTIRIKRRRWSPALSISHPQLASPLPYLISFPKSAKFFWSSSFASNLDHHHHLPTLASPETTASPQNLSSSPYGGHHAHVHLLPSKVNLGLQLVGFTNYGPLRPLQPISKRCNPTHYLIKPRSAPNFILFIFRQSLCLVSEPFVQGLQLGRYVSLLLWLFKISVRILPLDSPRVFGHELKSLIIEAFGLKKTGIMIPSPRSGDYRRFFNPSFPFPMNTETKQGLIINLKIIIQETRSMRKNGIMTPSPRSGGYRRFLNFLSPYPLLTEPTHVQIINVRYNFHSPKSLKLRFNYMYHVSSRRQTLCDILNLHSHVRENPPVLLRFFSHPLRILALASICYILSKLNSQSTTTLAANLKHQNNTSFARSHVKALLCVVLLVPARFTTLAPSSTPLGLLTVAICSSIDSFLDELSITFDLTCTKKLSSFWLKALKELYPYLSFFYLMLALGNALYGCIVNIGISDSFSVLGS